MLNKNIKEVEKMMSEASKMEWKYDIRGNRNY